MDSIREIALFEGGKLLCYQTKRSKSTRITIRFVLPMHADTVSNFAAVPGLIRYASKRYPETVQMERKLASLYGAGFSAIATKAGDMQVLSFTISTIADKFAFEGESISEECLRFLTECIFEPDLDENGLFKPENLAREKRLMIEDIKNAMGDKMQYSLNRFSALFYEGEGAAVQSTGTREQVEQLDVRGVTAAWHRMLEQASVLVCAVGDLNVDSVVEVLQSRFASCKRAWEPMHSVPHTPRLNVVKQQDIEPLEQCKLNLGFSVTSEDEDALKVMNMVFGQSEMSRLSKVVREKMSLCYYCSSAFGAKKKVVIVYSGIDAHDADKAVEAICRQLEAIQSGDFTQEEIDIAKRKMKDAYLSSLDTPADIAQWYLPQMLEDEVKSVEKSIQNIMAVDKARITACAKTVKPECIYTLGEQV